MCCFQICRPFSLSHVQWQVSSDRKTHPVSGTRTVFNGTESKTMFTSETAALPELALGEILVKVIQ
jgi:hypothetical protein